MDNNKFIEFCKSEVATHSNKRSPNNKVRPEDIQVTNSAEVLGVYAASLKTPNIPNYVYGATYSAENKNLYMCVFDVVDDYHVRIDED